MKSRVYFLPLVLIILVSGCTVSNYQGNYYFPENSVFDKANFKYITTISGTSSAKWNLLGLDKKKLPKGMAATAKNNMYSTYTLKPNQIITNVSTEMVYSYLTFLNLFSLGGYTYTAIVSADVYEFSDNGNYNPVPIIENSQNKVAETKKINSQTPTHCNYKGQKCQIIKRVSNTVVKIQCPTETEGVTKIKTVFISELD